MTRHEVSVSHQVLIIMMMLKCFRIIIIITIIMTDLTCHKVQLQGHGTQCNNESID